MILPNRHRYMDAIRLKAHHGNKCWLVLGQRSAWPNESIPPEEPLTATNVPDPFCAIKAEIKWMKEDPSGSFVYKYTDDNENTVTLKLSELQTEADVLAHSDFPIVLLTAEGDGQDIVDSYRAAAFMVDLVPAPGHENDTFLLAANVLDWGRIEALEYHKIKTVQIAGTYQIAQIIDY